MSKLPRVNLYNLTRRTVENFNKINTKISNKIKGTFIGRTVNYLNIVARDYKDVAISIQEDIKTKPLKSAYVVTGLGILMYTLKTNPNEQSFRTKHIQCGNELSLVNSSIVNPTSVQHIKYIQQCYNKDLVRYQSIGLFSIIWIDKNSTKSRIYEAKCPYLQIPYRYFGKQIIDVGFLNIWWVISRYMLDYDVNC